MPIPASKLREGLPGRWYHDPDHHRLELATIWQRHWICVGRVQDFAAPTQVLQLALGERLLEVCRDRDGRLRAWQESSDPPAEVPPRQPAVGEHLGFVFVNFDPQPGAGLGAALENEAAGLAAWPLQTLALAHREVHELACNWKVFWENYSECYHCPGIHPELSKLVPLYGQGLVRPGQLPEGHPLREAPVSLRPGAVSWTSDGATSLPDIAGLGPAQLEAGMTFADFLPGMFVIAHRDYVRSVRVWPLAPERTRLTVDWLLPEDTLALQPDLERLVSFARQVVAEDARACEINQAGLRSRAHRHGVLMPIEDGVAEFDDWVRAQLPRTAV